jgi:hypothetical protein
MSATGISPARYARICGALYLYIIVAGIFAEMFVRSKLVVLRDAEATARNILANETLFRIGFSAELLHLACDIGVATILYVLFRPADRAVSLLAAFLRLVCLVILAAASISHFAALRLLGSAEYLAPLGAERRHTLALLAMRLHGDAYSIALAFFGFACLALAYLIVRSRLLPRAIGALMALAGACYLVSSFAGFLNPAFAGTLVPGILVPPFVAELSLALWLLMKGVDGAKWEALR